VTHGTTAGTSELSVAGAYSGGLLDDLLQDLTVFGSEVLFNGVELRSFPSSARIPAAGTATLPRLI
jgi:hypothetical protein